jgi:hypothetical protein
MISYRRGIKDVAQNRVDNLVIQHLDNFLEMEILQWSYN